MNKHRHIIFDLDGTIIDSRNEILKTYNLVFRQIPPSKVINIESINLGLPLNEVLNAAYNNELDAIQKAKQLFSGLYDNSHYDETLLYDHAEETLIAFKENGFSLYIATNKRYLPTIRILEKKNIKHLFTTVMANEIQPGIIFTKQQMIAEIKHLGAFSEGYMIGDSVSDILAGKAENLRSIAVNYGYEREEVLALAEPLNIVNNFKNLFTFVLYQTDTAI